MAQSFCLDCEANWYNRQIMDCELCRLHRLNGWTFSQLLEVYAAREDVYETLNMPKGQLYPPLPTRSYLRPQRMKHVHVLNLRALRKPFRLLPKELQQKAAPLKADLVKFHAKENSKQAKAFVNQEMRLMSDFLMASTKEAKEFIFRGLDTWTQYLLNA